ncbi:MAG: FGGY family carbohydrate kinase, partial [Saprospiraceae bacterium]|nr:FGGY family carbohydrate kinase [Saprospiraceae bacterium]
MGYILALDQGTTSSRSILYNTSGEKVAVAQQEFTQYFPRPGWVEHDPVEIWTSQLATARDVLKHAGVQAQNVAAIGITNQRETIVLWDRKTGTPVAPAIVWQDRRTADFCQQLKAEGFEQHVRATTGLVCDPYFSGTKLHWLLEHVDGARQRAQAGELLAGTIDSWLLYNLTGGRVHATDYSNASRTMLYDIQTLQWDANMLERLAIPGSMLPRVFDSSGHFGDTDTALLGAAIPVMGIAGDQQAALFGQLCFTPGQAKN